MRLKSIDQILLILLFFVGTISTVLLLSREDQSNNLDSIAVIVSEINTVKRKANLFDSWRELTSGDTLQENDQIYTHDHSEVELRFKSGRLVQLLENSLLKISKDEDRESLKLEKGIIEARFNQKNNTQPLKIDLKGKTFLLDSNSSIVQLESTKDGGKIFVESGEMTISDGKSSTLVKENQSISQKKDGELGKVVDVFFLLVNPKNKFKLLKHSGNPEIPVGFKWKQNSKIASELLELYNHQALFSTTYDFKNISQSINLDLTKNEFFVNFSDTGKYFWKIRSIAINGDNRIDSNIRQFEIIPTSPSYITNTKNIFVKKTNGLKNEKFVTINWKNPMKDWIVSQKLHLKYNDKLVNEYSLGKNITSFNLSFEKDLVSLGNYSVVLTTELRDHNKSLFQAQSVAYGFKIIEDQIPIIKIKNPKKETIYNYKRQGIQKMLSWEVLSGVGNYEISLLKNNVQIFNTSTTDTFVDLPLTEEGKYQWRIWPRDGDKRTGEMHVGDIFLKFPKKLNVLPKAGEVLYLDSPNQEVQFKWEKNPRATGFIFELSENSDFNQLLVASETQKNNFSTRLGKTGNFYWRVKMKMGDQVEYSLPVSVEVKPAPLFEKPIIEEEIKLQLQKMDTSFIKKVPGTFKLTFRFALKLFENFFSNNFAQNEVNYKVEWKLKALKNVKAYIVEIYRDRDLQELVLKEEVSTDKLIWRKAKSGTFYWRLAYRDQWDRVTEFSNLSKLVIEPIKEEIKPIEVPEIVESLELLSPKHREEIRLNDEGGNLFLGNWITDSKRIDQKQEMEILFAFDLEFKQMFLKKYLKIKEDKLEGQIGCEDFTNSMLSEKNIIGLYWKMRNNKSGVESKRRFVTFYLEEMCPKLFFSKKTSTKENDNANSSSVLNEKRKETSFLFRNKYSFGFIPSLVNLKTKGSSYEAKANGMSFQALSLSLERFEKENLPILRFGTHSYYGEISYFSGKIFSNEKLQNISIELGSRVLSFLKLGTIYKKQTELVETNQSKIIGESVSLFGVSSLIEYQISPMRIDINFQFGNYLGYRFEIQRDIKFKNKSFLAGLFYQGMSFENEKRESSQNTFGLRFHYLLE